MIYSVGHSTLKWSDFRVLISDLDLLADIRSHPSSKWPQFQRETLERRLKRRYLWLPGLGGFRSGHEAFQMQFERYGVDVGIYAQGKFPKQRIAEKVQRRQKGPFWTNQGLWDFQFFMTMDEFRDAAIWVIQEAKTKNVGIMCSELLWWRCHRSQVADFLLFQGVDVVHLQPKPVVHSAVVGNRLARYHSVVLRRWKKWQPLFEDVKKE